MSVLVRNFKLSVGEEVNGEDEQTLLLSPFIVVEILLLQLVLLLFVLLFVFDLEMPMFKLFAGKREQMSM